MFSNKITMLKGGLFSLLTIFVSQIFAQQPILKSSVLQKGSALHSSTTISVPAPEKTSNNNNIKKLKGFDTDILAGDHEVVVVTKSPITENIDIYSLPLFGGYERTIEQQRSDLEFFKDCDRNFKSRNEASDFFGKMGWDYLSEGSKDLATNRFNLAWLLNNQNVDTYWGLGVIAYQNENFQLAEELMQEGLEKDNFQNVTLMVDLAAVHIKSFIDGKKPVDLSTAYELLDKAILIAPEFTNSYMQLSLANIADNKINEAWMAFHRGYEIDPNGVSTDVLDALLAIKADPMGIFRKP